MQSKPYRWGDRVRLKQTSGTWVLLAQMDVKKTGYNWAVVPDEPRTITPSEVPKEFGYDRQADGSVWCMHVRSSDLVRIW